MLGLDRGALGKAWGYSVAVKRVLWTSGPLPWPHYFVDPSGIGGSASPSSNGLLLAICAELGPPPAPRVLRVRPASPGPDYVWVDGYWYPVGRRYQWHEGYWTRPPYAGARWVAPHHDGEQFFEGYWEGDRGRFEHDHRWDRDADRDSERFRENRRDEHREGDRDDRH